ncbi:MAG: CDP-alcohol phosphatidyltransferase family protein [bacterium]
MKIKYSLGDIKKVSHPKTSVFDALISNPLSVRLTWVVANFTEITPNQITYLSFLAGLSSAWCFFQGTPVYLIFGVLFYILATVLDFMDGRMARLKKGSALGSFLDGACDGCKWSLNIFALCYGQFRITGQAIFLMLGLAISLVYFMMSSYGNIKKESQELYIKKEQKIINKAKSYNFLGKLKDFKNYFEKKGIYPFFTLGEATALIFIAGPVFGIIKECLIISLSFCLFMLVSHFIIIVIDLSRLR